MRALYATVVLTLMLVSHARAEETCLACHASRSEARLRAPVSARTHDVHASANVTCSECHGGDPDEPSVRAHDLGRGFRGVPDALGVTQVCSRCHDGSREGLTDVVTAYRAGRHGRAATLGHDAASCTSCHAAHGIQRHDAPDSPVAPAHVAETCGACHASEARMRSSGLPTDQLAQWRESVHGAAFTADPTSAPTCSTCHHAHDNAAGLSAVDACSTCHAPIRAAFDRGPHAAHFEQLGFLDCSECHGSHEIRPADATLLSGIGASCTRCHGPGQAAFVRVQRIEALASRLDAARAALPRDDPRRAALIASLHALDVDALEQALGDVPTPTVAASATPASGATSTSTSTSTSTRGWIPYALGALGALAVLGLWLVRRRRS